MKKVIHLKNEDYESKKPYVEIIEDYNKHSEKNDVIEDLFEKAFTEVLNEEIELEILKNFKEQLQKMIDYFYKHESKKDYQYYASLLDNVRTELGIKIAQAEGWYEGE